MDIKSSPVIALRPILNHHATMEESILPPATITMIVSTVSVNQAEITVQFITQHKNFVGQLNEMSYNDSVNKIMNHYGVFVDYAKLLVDKLYMRLFDYLKDRLPLHKSELSPNQHWVWISFKSKLKMIAVSMITSGHIVCKDSLQFKDVD